MRICFVLGYIWAVIFLFLLNRISGEDTSNNSTQDVSLNRTVTDNSTENVIIADNKTENKPIAEKLKVVRVRSRCFAAGFEGICLNGEECFTRGGQTAGGIQCGINLVCCSFIHTCGDSSSEKVTYFRSPDFPSKSIGSLACDYDIIVQKNVCAIRVDYENVNLARKLGGICDIDQLFILNSVDGPTSGQCGPLSGYSTTVAVNPSQTKPVKIAALIQNEATYYWDIKVTQLACNQVKHFRAPPRCGVVRNDITSSAASNFLDPQYIYDYDWYNDQKKSHQIWWNYPEPIFNTFFFATAKRYMQQSNIQNNNIIHSTRRVVSGTDALLGEFPWVVAIGLDQMFFCGGALINNHFVLTAAHCVMARDTPIGSLVLHLGDLDLTNINETQHILRGVRRVLFHSHFHPFLLANDIALLQFDQPVEFSDTVQPVCLPIQGESYTAVRASVVGWGVTSFPMGEPSPILQKLEVETLSNFQCSRMIEEPVTLGMICAAPIDLQGTCFGDSGGPLTYESPQGSHVLIGVVSFGVTGCAVTPAFPDLYTRVSEYMKWIDVNAM